MDTCSEPIAQALREHAEDLRQRAGGMDQMNAAGFILAADLADTAAARYIACGRVTKRSELAQIPGQLEIPGCDK